MNMRQSAGIAALAGLLPAVAFAQSTAGQWGQCGGSGWTGATLCPTGWTCTYSNDFYSQCLQSSTTATTSKTSTTSSVSSTKSTTSTTSSTKTTTSTNSVSTTKTSTSSSATPTQSGAGPSRLTGKLPALGWNSWNAYQGNINETKILAAANQIVSLGLKTAGYQYVNIDDCWSDISGRDATTGRIKPDLNKFPNGIKYVADQIHALGLKAGIYSDAGTLTCAGFPGSLEHETVDAQTWSEWGIDYLKYDNCNVPSTWTDNYNPGTGFDWYNSNSGLRYRRMTDALSTVSNPIQYGICNWGNANVWAWGARVGHSWRLSGDSSATWSYITSIINTAVSVIQYVDFYAHGDMDMMEIGNGALTINEQRTHFAAWVFLKSPILLGTNLAALTTEQLAIIKNAELLAFSQDATYGKPALPYTTGSPPEFYSGTSSVGAHVFVINLDSSTASKVITFSAVPELAGSTSWKIHNMWTGADLGTFSTSYTVSLGSHDTAALRFNKP